MPANEDPLEGIDPDTIVWGTAHLTAEGSSEPPETDPEPQSHPE